MQLVGDKHVIAEHFNTQCNINLDSQLKNSSKISSNTHDTSLTRPTVISNKDQQPPDAENVLMPVFSNVISSVIANKEQELENKSIPGSSVINHQEHPESSSIPGSTAEALITEEEHPEVQPENESLPETCEEQMARNYSCDECTYVAKLPHHLRVILNNYYYYNNRVKIRLELS